MATDRSAALRQAIHCCRKGGTVSIPGVYGGFLDKVPIGAAFSKGLTLKMGQTHVHATCRRCWSASSAARSIRRSSSPTALRLEDAPERLQDVPGQAGRLHQGGDEAVARPGLVNGDG